MIDIQTIEYLIKIVESDKNLKLCFEAMQKEEEAFDCVLEFVHLNATRWVSTIQMMERFCLFERVLCNSEHDYYSDIYMALMCEFPQHLSHDIFSPDFFVRLNGYVMVLKPYKHA
jgi:hypothetical protein